MTPEELVIEQKVQQLYANTPNWPQIPQNEMDQLCKQLLTTETIRKITTKAIKKYPELNLENVKNYMNTYSACLFETLVSTLANYNPEKGRFIPYFSRSFKLDLEHELLKETNDRSDGGMTMPTSFNGIKIDHMKKLLDQERKQRNASMTKEEEATSLRTHSRLSNKQISYLLNPPTVTPLVIQNEDGEEVNILEDSYIPSEQDPLTPEKKQERQETCLQVLSTVEEIVSTVAVRADTMERYRVVATWEVIQWFEELHLDINEILEPSSKGFTFLHPQVIEDYRTLRKDFYTEDQELAKRGFFPTKSKVSKYKASFEFACQEHPELGNLIASLTNR